MSCGRQGVCQSWKAHLSPQNLLLWEGLLKLPPILNYNTNLLRTRGFLCCTYNTRYIFLFTWLVSNDWWQPGVYGRNWTKLKINQQNPEQLVFWFPETQKWEWGVYICLSVRSFVWNKLEQTVWLGFWITGYDISWGWMAGREGRRRRGKNKEVMRHNCSVTDLWNSMIVTVREAGKQQADNPLRFQERRTRLEQ